MAIYATQKSFQVLVLDVPQTRVFLVISWMGAHLFPPHSVSISKYWMNLLTNKFDVGGYPVWKLWDLVPENFPTIASTHLLLSTQFSSLISSVEINKSLKKRLNNWIMNKRWFHPHCKGGTHAVVYHILRAHQIIHWYISSLCWQIIKLIQFIFKRTWNY